ncbi:uncharacterized protein LOC112192508 isoform X3 [Rosa chinensis]|uniref:uncharacterized protein LOC112192508 isoform X3 n=1 Tax=Rosa chinensis TaxID=74649 RepID=UPI000D093B58|nr:uncharacterized protein LOC112192508 isoform X3 [Rosa chinensis]
MTSKTLRRRLHHGDVDGKAHEHLEASASEDGLNEPLLGNYESPERHSEESALADLWNDERRMEQLHWTLLFSQLIAQWARWLANIVLGSGSLIGRFLTSATQNGQSTSLLAPALTPVQEVRLKNLRQRLEVPFDGSRVEHQESFHRLLHKQDGTRAEWEYPFAVAGINISFVLAQMLDLQSAKPTSLAGIRFLQLLQEDEMAFDNLYCVTFQMMDAQWLAKRASYMEFNDVMKSTTTQLERELALEDVTCVKDLPAYNLLAK